MGHATGVEIKCHCSPSMRRWSHTGNNQPLNDFKTHSEGHVGWLLREPEAPLLVDQTAQFHAKLRELGRRKEGVVTRKLLIDVFGLPPQQGGWDGVSVLLIPGLWTKWYPLYWVHLRQARRRVEINQ